MSDLEKIITIAQYPISNNVFLESIDICDKCDNLGCGKCKEYRIIHGYNIDDKGEKVEIYKECCRDCVIEMQVRHKKQFIIR